jgi:hypothetical protein
MSPIRAADPLVTDSSCVSMRTLTRSYRTSSSASDNPISRSGPSPSPMPKSLGASSDTGGSPDAGGVVMPSRARCRCRCSSASWRSCTPVVEVACTPVPAGLNLTSPSTGSTTAPGSSRHTATSSSSTAVTGLFVTRAGTRSTPSPSPRHPARPRRRWIPEKARAQPEAVAHRAGPRRRAPRGGLEAVAVQRCGARGSRGRPGDGGVRGAPRGRRRRTARWVPP